MWVSSCEGQREPFRDSTEMSRLHLGVVISEKEGSLVQFLLRCLYFLRHRGLPRSSPEARHRELSHLPSLSSSNSPSSQL